MGRPKASIDVGGVPLVKRVIDQVKKICDEVVIVTKTPADYLEYNVKTVRDLAPKQGPLGGIATGLFFARNFWSLAAACDLPFIKSDVLKLIAEKTAGLTSGPRIIVPQTPGGWQPLVAAYSRDCFSYANKLLAQGNLKVDDLKKMGVAWSPIPEKELRAVDNDLTSFMNLNTPEELESARKLLET